MDSYIFGVENRTTVPMEVQFNVGRSQNFLCSARNFNVKKIVDPSKLEFLNNIRREDIGDEMLLDYSFRFQESQ